MKTESLSLDLSLVRDRQGTPDVCAPALVPPSWPLLRKQVQDFAKPAFLELNGTAKYFGPVEALAGVDLTVERGSVVALLGPNGAGKSTLFGCLLGLVRPSSGTVLLEGNEITDADRRRFGYAAERVALFPQRTVWENGLFFCRLRDQRPEDFECQLQRVGLWPVRDRLVRHLSKGMLQRLGLAIAFCGAPDVLVLDEPFNGLDPVLLEELQLMLRQERERGATLLISTHTISAVESLATDAAILLAGRLAAAGPISELQTRFGHADSLEALYYRIARGQATPAGFATPVEAEITANLVTNQRQEASASLRPMAASMPKLNPCCAKENARPRSNPVAAAIGHTSRTGSRGLAQVFHIAFKEFTDRLRSGWVIACALVWLGAVALTSLFGLVQVGNIGLQGYERTVASLLSLVQYLVPLLALLLGHDLLVTEREERTLSLMLAAGVSRARALAGKFLGGCFALATPLLLGFAIAGAAIGLAAKDTSSTPFLKLALTGLALGIVFLGIGLLISCFSRTRVQALVLALLAWCAAVFAFDLAAMGVVVMTSTTRAAREVENFTDATHVNAAADMHAAFENGDDAAARSAASKPQRVAIWLALNPVDIFRTINLPKELAPKTPIAPALVSLVAWLGFSWAASLWKLKRADI